MKHFRAYIDESGDEGFLWRSDGQGASPWFFLSAVVVPTAAESAAISVVHDIRLRLGLDQHHTLHWVDRRRHNDRKVIVQEIAKAPILIISVGVDKQRLAQTVKLREPPGLYLYATRYLLERVSWLVGDAGGRVDCIFENRSNLSYTALEKYITALASDRGCEIRPVIDSISPRNKAQSKILQIADAAAGAAFAAFRPDKYGNVEPSYLLTLGPLLYRRGGNLFSYGLKLFPRGGRELISSGDYMWLKGLQ